jgi:ribosomal protein L32
MMIFLTVRLVIYFMFQNVLTLWIQFLNMLGDITTHKKKLHMIMYIEDKSCNKKFGPHRICPKDKKNQFKKYV